jgi:hypothetical protein
VQLEEYTTCDGALDVCEIKSVDQVLDQHLTRPKEEEEVSEHTATFLDVLKGLEAARKYVYQFDIKNNGTVMYNEAENELYRLTVHEKNKQRTFIEWLKKWCN